MRSSDIPSPTAFKSPAIEIQPEAALSFAPDIIDVGERRFIAFPAHAGLAFRLAPKRRVDSRKIHVAFGRKVDFSDEQPVGAIDRLAIDFAAAGDDDLIRDHFAADLFGKRQRRLDVLHNANARRREIGVARDDDRLPPRQGRPMNSKFRRPITSGLPQVSARKRSKSVESFQINLLSAPITPLRATAATRAIGKPLTPPPAP